MKILNIKLTERLSLHKSESIIIGRHYINI